MKNKIITYASTLITFVALTGGADAQVFTHDGTTYEGMNIISTASSGTSGEETWVFSGTLNGVDATMTSLASGGDIVNVDYGLEFGSPLSFSTGEGRGAGFSEPNPNLSDPVVGARNVVVDFGQAVEDPVIFFATHAWPGDASFGPGRDSNGDELFVLTTIEEYVVVGQPLSFPLHVGDNEISAYKVLGEYESLSFRWIAPVDGESGMILQVAAPVTQAPEPSSALLSVIAGGALLLRRRR